MLPKPGLWALGMAVISKGPTSNVVRFGSRLTTCDSGRPHAAIRFAVLWLP